jgi:hypothetical protein
VKNENGAKEKNVNYLTADPELVKRLSGILETLEIRDPNGKLLGLYTPAINPEVKDACTEASELFDLEEAERILANERHLGRPLREIMRDLQLGKGTQI